MVALLLDAGPDGQWATRTLLGADLIAPGILRFEVANIVRRHEVAGLISPDQAAQAHGDLLELPIEQWPYEILAHRAWQLRHNLTTHDASYVALAEQLDVVLVTLDHRIARANGVRCPVAVPPAASPTADAR
jgi:predicted nucleic acid-binding protein